MKNNVYLNPSHKPNLPDTVKYKTDLSRAWLSLEEAFNELDAAVEERIDSMIPLRLASNELERILKAIVENVGQMTQMQIDAVNKYYGWGE